MKAKPHPAPRRPTGGSDPTRVHPGSPEPPPAKAEVAAGPDPVVPSPTVAGGWPAFVLGAFLGLAVAKAGNPAILDHLATVPGNLHEAIFLSWPLGWSYAVLVVAGLLCGWRFRWRPRIPAWLVWLPAGWLVWQGIAALGTVDPSLTRATLPYLASVVACFYLGLGILAGERQPTALWLGYLPGFAFMLATGFDQQFGGLAATREQMMAQPGWENLPAEFIERVNKMRVFATLLYPNALAGVLLLMLPGVAVAVWRLTAFLTPPTRGLLSAGVAAAGLACLYWSRSKAGWLVLLVMGGVVFWRLPFARRWKTGLTVGLLVLGLTAFFVRFADYFDRGATSVGARFDYWRAAGQVVVEHPLRGTGPGTFAAEYRRRKPPEAEMARLTHNDYLQQAADSGLPGALLYAGFVWGMLGILARRCWSDPLAFAVWLGLLGWALQSGVEFGLYIPAIGWPAFLLLGWLAGHEKQCASPWAGARSRPGREAIRQNP